MSFSITNLWTETADSESAARIARLENEFFDYYLKT
jgi:hypothetical protein